MESRAALRRWLLSAACLPFACAAATAAAQEERFYRSIDQNGRVTFSDRPPANARFVETIKVQTGPLSTGAPGNVQEQRGAAREQLQADANARAQGLAEADRRISAAYAALKAARAAQVSGKEPLPGERVGTASGASRLREEYWDRQRTLQTAVEDAQRELQAGLSERNRLR